MAQPYRADHVGSLLRPPELVQARQDFNQGRMSGEQLRDVEDRPALQALDIQRQVGIDIYTEREYRRSGWSNGQSPDLGSAAAQARAGGRDRPKSLGVNVRAVRRELIQM